jgi:hypothetical protein
MRINPVAVFALSLLILPLSNFSPVRAQDQKKKEVEKKALVLLENLIEESASLPSAENRISVLIEACQLLWSRDQARARNLLEELKEQINSFNTNPASAASQNRQNLRMRLLDWLGSKNAELALDFLRSTRDTREKGILQDETQLELRLASAVAATDPQMAFQMAKELLKTNSGSQVVEIWRNLRGNDPTLGRKLTDEILAELRSKDLLNNGQNFYLAISLLYQLRETTESTDPSPSGQKGAPVSQASRDGERQAYRDLLDLIAGSALKFMSDKSTAAIGSNGVSGQELLVQINNLMPEIESELPTRATGLRGKVTQYEKILPISPTIQNSEFVQQIKKMEGKSGKELLEIASAAPQQIMQPVLVDAISKAGEQGDLETARNIAKLHESDYPELKQFLSQLEGDFAVKNVANGKYDEAKKMLSNLGSDDERVSLLIKFATGARGKNDEKTSRAFLDEAGAIMGDKMQTNKELSAQIAIAEGYREIDPNRSFELMEAAIERLNQVSLAAQEYFTFTSNDSAETSLMYNPIMELFSSFAPVLSQLAQQDFDRSAAILKRTKIDEIKVKLGFNLLTALLSDNRGIH